MSLRVYAATHPRWSAALFMAGAGILVLAMSAGDWVPMRALAERLASDGVLSAGYAAEIARTQYEVGLALLVSAVAFSMISAPLARRVLLALPARGFYAGAAATVFLMGLLVQERLFQGIPHMTDAISHLFQAHILANRHMYAPTPPCPDSFYQFHIIMTYTGKWFTKYTPGHSLLLGAALMLGLLKVVMPMCAAGVTLLWGRLIEKYDRPVVARVFVVLWAFSPLALLLSGSFMSHYSAMLFSVCGVYAYLRAAESERPGARWRWGVLSGATLGYAALIRPHEFAMMGLIGGSYMCSLGAISWRWLGRVLPALLAGVVAPALIWVTWNRALYGHPFVLGYGFSNQDVLHPAFQGQFGFNANYTLRDAVSVLVWNLDRANRALLGWPGSLWLLPLALLARGERRLVGLSLLGVAVVMGVYFFYDYRAEYEGRYYFGALPFFVYLSVKGLQVLSRIGPVARQTALLLVAAFYVHAGINYWPDYIIPRYGQDFEETHAELDQRIQALRPGRSVVLLDDENGSPFFYSSGFIHNDPWLRREIIYARYAAGQIDCLAAAFPDRALYLYRPTSDGKGALDRVQR